MLARGLIRIKRQRFERSGGDPPPPPDCTPRRLIPCLGVSSKLIPSTCRSPTGLLYICHYKFPLETMEPPPPQYVSHRPPQNRGSQMRVAGRAHAHTHASCYGSVTLPGVKLRSHSPSVFLGRGAIVMQKRKKKKNCNNYGLFVCVAAHVHPALMVARVRVSLKNKTNNNPISATS